MKSSSSSLHRRGRSHHLKTYRPVIELLERRLPPGSMFTSLFLGGSTLALEIDENKLDAAIPALQMIEKAEIRGETLSPSRVATGVAADSVVHEPIQNPRAPTSDILNVELNSPRSRVAPYRIAMNGPPVAGMQTGGLTAPAQGRATGFVRSGSVRPNSPNVAAGNSAAHAPNSQAPSEAEILDNYGKMPLSFEQNVGQFDDRVDFVSRAGGSTLFLTPTAAVFSMQNPKSRIVLSEPGALATGFEPAPVADASGSDSGVGVAVHMNIVGGNPGAQASAVGQLPGITNYFIGNDPTQWHTDIASFGRVEYDDVYPGIDLAYYGNNGQWEYDFIVSPGADPSAIALNFAGADGMEINPQGELVVHTAVGDVVQQKPFTYQENGDARQEVASGYIMDGGTVRFQVGAHDANRSLVIDPVVVLGYSTFLGGSFSDVGSGIAVDVSGNTYMTGTTFSSNFPTTPGAFDTTKNANADAFVTKLNSAGWGLAYSSYLGGFSDDFGNAIAVDGIGNIYVAGRTESSNFPTTTGAFDTTFDHDAFVTRLSATGSGLAYSTFLGGSDDQYLGVGDDETATAIAVDGSGNAYVTGHTPSSDFPTTAGAFDTTFNGCSTNSFCDAFVSKINPIGTALVYSTFLGGGDSDYGLGIAVDGGGNAYVTGNTVSFNFPTVSAYDYSKNGLDAFVTKLNATGSALAYSTYLGAPGGSYGESIAVDGGGNAYVTGRTYATNFPTTPGAFDTTFNGGSYDAFVTKLAATGSTLAYSTFLGGSDFESGKGIAVDAGGNAYVTGRTDSTNFPIKPGAFDTIYSGGYEAFVTKLNPAGSALPYSTFLGGAGNDYGEGIAVDAGGNAYVTGDTTSINFPTNQGAFDTTHNGGTSDAFVTKLRLLPNACGCFDPHTISTAANGAASVFAADVDGDGDTDVLSASNQDDKIAWYENNGSESFAAHTITTGADVAVSVYAADVDSDGDTDVLSASRNDDKIAWYRNNGSETFTTHVISFSANDPSSVMAADVDRDGDMDVLSASFQDDKIAWYENNGSETFTAQTITTVANGAVDVFVADLDGDGDIDVLSASAYDDKIAWYKNDGAENFTPHTISTFADFANGVYATDVDHDGDVDVLSSSFSDNKIAWYENNGVFNPTFTTHIITTAATGAVDVFTADVNHDGHTDVLSASNSDNKIAWYKNDGGQNFTAQIISTAASGATSVFAADVDGDDDIDVLSTSFHDDKIAWYENVRFNVTPPTATPVIP